MDELISNAWELMSLGMGTVFTFLALLVLAVSIMSRSLARFADAPGPDKTPPLAGRSPLAVDRPIPATHRRAIELALAQHRKRK